MTRPHLQVAATVIGAPDPAALAAFYGRLLDWEVVEVDPTWAVLRPPAAGPGLSFQLEPDFVPAVWPAQAGSQQMTSHLDIAVDDLDEAVAWAIEVGATRAPVQPQLGVCVMLDPVGHPFCLFPHAG